MKKKIRESFDSYVYRDDDDIHSSRQVKDLFKRELFHPTRDYSRQMKQAMAYTVEKNLHEKEKKNMKVTLNESEYDNPYGFTYKNTVITDKFGNYWTMDTWANNLSEPYATFDDAEASMLQCMEDCGVPTAEDVPDAEDYAFEFTTYAARVVPNYIVGYEATGDVSDDKNRVHSFAFDFIITGDDLASAEEARDRILNEINLVEGIEVVGNPNIDPCSWSKQEYGISESVEKDSKELKEDAAGKYTVLYEKFARGEFGGVHTKSFKAKDDWEAILKIKQHDIGPIAVMTIVKDNEVYDCFDSTPQELEDFLADKGYESLEKFIDEEGAGMVAQTIDDVIDIINTENGMGDDSIFYIRRPDGSYLYRDEESGEDDDDWDDED